MRFKEVQSLTNLGRIDLASLAFQYGSFQNLESFEGSHTGLLTMAEEERLLRAGNASSTHCWQSSFPCLSADPLVVKTGPPICST
jgi:hypothetical protein